MVFKNKGCSHRSVVFAGVRYFVILFSLVGSSASHSEILNGQVVGQDGTPKQFVSVSVFGVKNRRTQTNNDGTFTVNLPPGSYVIRVWQQPNRQDFTYIIDAEKPVDEQEFKVSW